jgi:hypothetical protein
VIVSRLVGAKCSGGESLGQLKVVVESCQEAKKQLELPSLR